MAGSLHGLKVLDLCSHLSGPYCAMLLADHGADVIKIEKPKGGDEARGMPPYVAGQSAPFMLWNRNKRSIALDLKSEAGSDAILDLVDQADSLTVAVRLMKFSRHLMDGLPLEQPNRISGRRFATSLPLQLKSDARFCTNADRVSNNSALVGLLQQQIRLQASAYWLEAMNRIGIPCGPVLATDEILADPHVLARETVAEVEHPAAGRMKTLGVVAKLSETPGAVRNAAPRLGEHTEEILSTLNMSGASAK
jgi:crotonobetainyl-CoA:carnitine CoA-transferase CaiB-like acyl-CoA transferase